MELYNQKNKTMETNQKIEIYSLKNSSGNYINGLKYKITTIKKNIPQGTELNENTILDILFNIYEDKNFKTIMSGDILTFLKMIPDIQNIIEQSPIINHITFDYDTNADGIEGYFSKKTKKRWILGKKIVKKTFNSWNSAKKHFKKEPAIYVYIHFSEEKVVNIISIKPVVDFACYECINDTCDIDISHLK